MNGLARLLDPSLAREAVALVLTEDGVETAAIEGEQLSTESVRSSVAHHLGLPTAGLPPTQRRADGLVEMLLDASTRYEEPLTLERLLGWHSALFPEGRSGLRAIRAGALRGAEPMHIVSGHYGEERIHYTAPPRKMLEAELATFLDWFNAPPPKLDGLVRACVAHFWFEALHPFEDGNGRIGRALIDMALCQDEGSPLRPFRLSAQLMREREGYYEALRSASRGAPELTDFLGWFLPQIEAAALSAERVMGNVLEKARFWVRHRETELNARQRKVLNVLLDAGAGAFVGGMNTRKYMSLTRVSRATASRELGDLVAKGCLAPIKSRGRSAAYELPTEASHHID